MITVLALTLGLGLSPAEPVCRVTDSRVTEISGLTATETGYAVVTPGGREMFLLDRDCRVTGTAALPDRPVDVRDLARQTVPGLGDVTGGALSPDGRYVVLRTGTEAFEYDVVLGDVAKSLAEGTPRVIALDGGPGGVIAYSADGTRLLTVSGQSEIKSFPVPVRGTEPSVAYSSDILLAEEMPSRTTVIAAAAGGVLAVAAMLVFLVRRFKAS